MKDFVPAEAVESICRAVNGQKSFYHEKSVRGGKTIFKLTLKSVVVDDELAASVWRGNNYLVHFDLEYNGRDCGIGGVGFATDDYCAFKNRETFKRWFDNHMKTYTGYEVDEYGQLSLF